MVLNVEYHASRTIVGGAAVRFTTKSQNQWSLKRCGRGDQVTLDRTRGGP
jgi:hypothetical protein